MKEKSKPRYRKGQEILHLLLIPLYSTIAIGLQNTFWLNLGRAYFQTMYPKKEHACEQKLPTYLSVYKSVNLLNWRAWWRKSSSKLEGTQDNYLYLLTKSFNHKQPTKDYPVLEDNKLPEIGQRWNKEAVLMKEIILKTAYSIESQLRRSQKRVYRKVSKKVIRTWHLEYVLS